MALDLIDKIKNDEIKLAQAKKYQIVFKSNLDEIKKGKQHKKIKRVKKTHYTILKCFTKQEARLLIF